MRITCRYEIVASSGPLTEPFDLYYENMRLPREIIADDIEEAIKKFKEAWLHAWNDRAERIKVERCTDAAKEQRTQRVPVRPFISAIKCVGSVIQ